MHIDEDGIEYYRLEDIPLTLRPATTVYSVPILVEQWNGNFGIHGFLRENATISPLRLFAGILHCAMKPDSGDICVVANVHFYFPKTQPRYSAFSVTLSDQKYYAIMESLDFPMIRCLGRKRGEPGMHQVPLFAIARTPSAKRKLEGLSCVVGPGSPMRFNFPASLPRFFKWRWNPYNTETSRTELSTNTVQLPFNFTRGQQW